MPAAGALQCLWINSLRIHLNPNEIDSNHRSGGLQAGIGQRFGKNAIARFGQREQETEESGLRSR